MRWPWQHSTTALSLAFPSGISCYTVYLRLVSLSCTASRNRSVLRHRPGPKQCPAMGKLRYTFSIPRMKGYQSPSLSPHPPAVPSVILLLAQKFSCSQLVACLWSPQLKCSCWVRRRGCLYLVFAVAPAIFYHEQSLLPDPSFFLFPTSTSVGAASQQHGT